MVSVRIFGAGSIGNHLAHGCRQKNWNVEICDVDRKALDRTRNDIYPSRYGQWDETISLVLNQDLTDEFRDIVIVGTPPEYHIPVALDQIRKIKPKIVLIEKPLCCPSLEGLSELREVAEQFGCVVLTGYNHTLSHHTKAAQTLLEERAIGDTLAIDAGFREYWGGIFAAHPWLDGPHDSYLGFLEKGGGATGEHSHAINIWQHFAHFAKCGRIVKVAAMHDIVKDNGVEYDRIGQMVVETETGLIGNIVQDVITEPAVKKLRIQGTEGVLNWQVSFDSDKDAVLIGKTDGSVTEKLFPKTRPDDFAGEIDHLEALLADSSIDSPISLTRGVETMLVVAAAYKSSRENKVVTIDYTKEQQNGLS